VIQKCRETKEKNHQNALVYFGSARFGVDGGGFDNAAA
jgi:hypothetical protein